MLKTTIFCTQFSYSNLFSKKLARTTIKDIYVRISALVNGELAVRINPPGSSFAKDDIFTLFGGQEIPQTVVVPKISCFEDLHWVRICLIS